jgi:hypothetical protein
LPPAPPSLERFYPEADEALGIGASDISEEARKRHFHRYSCISDLLAPYISETDVIADVGSGSGYGTDILGAKYRYVFGVEPNNAARAYAAKHFPEIKFQTDLEGAEVIVMIESIEHMTKTEVRSYIYDARVVAVTTPFVENPNNAYHLSPFRCSEDIEAAFRKEGFVLMESRLEKDVPFTTGEFGDQYYGIFSRPMAPTKSL